MVMLSDENAIYAKPSKLHQSLPRDTHPAPINLVAAGPKYKKINKITIRASQTKPKRGAVVTGASTMEF